MTLERRGDAVILRECPFCEADLVDGEGQRRNCRASAAAHLAECEAFYERMDVDPDDPLPLHRDDSDGRTPTADNRDEVPA